MILIKKVNKIKLRKDNLFRINRIKKSECAFTVLHTGRQVIIGDILI